MGSSEAKCMELGDGILRKINQNQKDQTYVLYHMVQILTFPVWCVYVTLVSGEFTAYCVCAHTCVYTQIRRAEVSTECLPSIVLHHYFLRQGLTPNLSLTIQAGCSWWVGFQDPSSSAVSLHPDNDRDAQ